MVYAAAQPATLIGPGYAPRGPAVLSQGLVVKTTHVSTELRLAMGRQGTLQRVAGPGAGVAATAAPMSSSSTTSAAAPKPAKAPPPPPAVPRLVGVVRGPVAHSRELLASQVLSTPMPVRARVGAGGLRLSAQCQQRPTTAPPCHGPVPFPPR